MSVTIELSPEIEQLLQEQADSRHVSVNEYVSELIQREIAVRRVEAAMQRMANRSEEEKAATRAEIMARARPARPLPPGKTLEDVFVGKWPGDETDEEIAAALEDLS